MIKSDLEAKVKELDTKVKTLQQNLKDIGSATDIYELSALKNAALIYELGKTFDKTNFSELLDKQLAMSKSIKSVKDNKLLQILKEEIERKNGKITGEINIFKGNKRGVVSCIYQLGSIYGGFLCAIYRVSVKN